ncbi:DUF294 nucleotidyltransferase-like domain-containing protein [Pelagibius sp. Alg239-R121]|uniref:DUF294 nucleotidyltransferase-like domain-containing protein n=1 Tax=Pelagibius sp. Alg239-R121 TaxID=2993448 RepID=UPI0024A70CDF|nr:DUF294 nucleotidyltransferase-like domain-containing protein [Pelagibius sp. Alg239-R121]
MTVNEDLKRLLARTPPFSGFSTDECNALAASVILQACPKDSVILAQDSEHHENLYLVVSGQVRLIETAVGSVTRTFGEGKFFGHYGLLRGGPLPFQAEAISDTMLASIPAERFHLLCEKHPRVRAFFESDVRVYTRHHVTLYDLSGAQFLFGTRLSDLVRREPPVCEPDLSVQAAAGIMSEQRCDFLLVARDAAIVGLLTDSDLRNKVVAAGVSLETPVSQVMNGDIGFLTARNSLFEAMLMMLKRNLSHVLVRAGNDRTLVGVVSDTEIARSHGYNPLLLLNQITQATDFEALAELRREANRQLLQLYRRGVRAQDLITINTLINDNLTGHALDLCEVELAEHRPDADFDWAWLSMGSEGRGEMSLKTDQDNAVVYRASKADLPAVDAWLSRWAGHVNQALDQIGLSLCEGGMMAGNPLWRHALESWPAQFDDWLARSEANQIMQVAAACDLRAVHGDLSLEEPVKQSLITALGKNPRFLQHMARGVISLRPPLGKVFGRIRTFKTEDGRKINIKRRGLQPITDFARVLSLRRGYTESSNTFDRLAFLLEAEPKLKSTLQDALDAYRHLNDIRLGQHLYDVSVGVAPTNWVSVDKLSDTQHEMLKAAFRAIESIQAVLAQRY